MLSDYVKHEDCYPNDLLKLCLWLKHLRVDAEKIRRWANAFDPATRYLISVIALDDWNATPGSLTESVKTFQGKKGFLGHDFNAITAFKWLYENRDKSPEVVGFIKSLHNNQCAWLELTSGAKPVHRPIIDWVWQITSEAPCLVIIPFMAWHCDPGQHEIEVVINALRAVSYNRQLIHSIFGKKNPGRVATLLLLVCEGPFEPILADIFADGLAEHFDVDFHDLLWGEFNRHFLLGKEPVKNGNPLGMPIVDGSLRPDLYLDGLSRPMDLTQ